MSRAQSGNVIFYILIAVALLAALSYTVAGSLRGGGQAISGERLAMNATEVIEYGNVLSGAIAQMRLRGVKDEEISFENATLQNYINPNCVSPSCQVFNLEGGAINYANPKAEWLDQKHKDQIGFGALYITGASIFSDSSAANATNDLILYIPYIQKGLCDAVQKKLGLTENSRFEGVLDRAAPFAGVYGDSSGAMLMPSSAASAGCVEDGESYSYYQVLIAR